MHVVAAYLMYIHNFAKIVHHLGGHLGFLGLHHDSSQSPSIFLHLRYFSNHLWNNFLWTSHAHRHPLRVKAELLFNKVLYHSITFQVCVNPRNITMLRPINKSIIFFSYFSAKTYLAGTQKISILKRDGSFEHTKTTQVNRMSKSRRVLAIGGKQRSFGQHMVCFEMVLYHNEPH